MFSTPKPKLNARRRAGNAMATGTTTVTVTGNAMATGTTMIGQSRMRRSLSLAEGTTESTFGKIAPTIGTTKPTNPVMRARTVMPSATPNVAK